MKMRGKMEDAGKMPGQCFVARLSEKSSSSTLNIYIGGSRAANVGLSAGELQIVIHPNQLLSMR
jgi:hypothetical protein